MKGKMMFFCHYSFFDGDSEKWIERVCWADTPDDAYRGVLQQCEWYGVNPDPESCHFGKGIQIEVETRTVSFVVEAE